MKGKLESNGKKFGSQASQIGSEALRKGRLVSSTLRETSFWKSKP